MGRDPLGTTQVDDAITGNPQHVMVVAIPWKPSADCVRGPHKYLYN